jgi:Fe-S-cluster-containing hydrogenase component 2
MAKRIMLIENPPLITCVGCRTCELACSFFHEKKFSYQKSRIRIVREELAVSRPVVCEQCADPPCAKVCQIEAIMRNPKTGSVLVNEAKCNGCGVCIDACPFGAIWLHPDAKKVIKCDLCNGAPQCVKFCPQRVLRVEGGD